MSRCILDHEDRMIQVPIGWDPGMQSFFTRLRDRDLFLKEKRAGKSESEAGVCLSTAGFDRIWTPPDPLIEMIQPHACRHNKRRLGVETGPPLLRGSTARLRRQRPFHAEAR